MSKTFESQVMKAQNLAEEMKKHLNELSAKGVKQETLDLLIKTSEEAIRISREVDELRDAASKKLREANMVLGDVKAKYNELRMVVRNNYPIDKWCEFGLMDKR